MNSIGAQAVIDPSPWAMGSSEISESQKAGKESSLLYQAIKEGDLEKARRALESGSSVSSWVVGDCNALHYASEEGHLDIVRLLLDWVEQHVSSREDFISYLDAPTMKWECTALHRACVQGHDAIVEELIHRGATVHIRSQNCGSTPLENAITFGHLRCCSLLIQAGAPVNEINPQYRTTPLLIACKKGNYEVIELLLNNGADPNLRALVTPLYEVVGSPNALQLMIDRGAKVNTGNEWCSTYQSGCYPIHAAVLACNVESLKILIAAGANRSVIADGKVLNGKCTTPCEMAEQLLHNEKTNPQNSPEATALNIQRLEKIIHMLSR